MALSLLDIAAAEVKPLKRAIMMSMFKGRLPSPADFLPVENAQGLTQQIVRMTDGGSPTTRNINEAVAAYQAKFSDREETLKIIENKIVIDKVLLDVKTYIQDPIAMQTRAYGEIVKNTVNNLLINGDPTSDTSDPAGLDFRIKNDAFFLNQSVNAANLDVDASDANRLTWLDHIDNVITLVGGGASGNFIVNRQTWIKFRSSLRALKLLDTTKDQFDREITQYGNHKIYDAGLKPAGAVSGAVAQQVIGDDTHTSAYGTASTTPMYLVSVEGDEGARLLQLHPLRVTKVGLDPGDPKDYVVDVTWPVGFLFPSKYALGSIQGLNIT